MSNPLLPTTEEFLNRHALRIDGYAWAKAQGATDDTCQAYLQQQLYQPFCADWRIPVDPDAALALNFYLFRSFYHWGHLPGTGAKEWWQMCLLYLHTYRLNTPAAYRHPLAREWEQRPKGSAEVAAAEIRLAMMGPAR